MRLLRDVRVVLPKYFGALSSFDKLGQGPNGNARASNDRDAAHLAPIDLDIFLAQARVIECPLGDISGVLRHRDPQGAGKLKLLRLGGIPLDDPVPDLSLELDRQADRKF